MSPSMTTQSHRPGDAGTTINGLHLTTSNSSQASHAQHARSDAEQGAREKLMRRRSRKACVYCHSRKIRCDVGERGTPCSNCVDQGSGNSCTIRRRKNARAEPGQTPNSATSTNGPPSSASNPPSGSVNNDQFRRHSVQSITAATPISPPTITWPDAVSHPQNIRPATQTPQNQPPPHPPTLQQHSHGLPILPPISPSIAPPPGSTFNQDQQQVQDDNQLQRWGSHPQQAPPNSYGFFDPSQDQSGLGMEPPNFDFSNLMDIESFFSFNDNPWPQQQTSQHHPQHPQVEFGFSAPLPHPTPHQHHLQHASPASVLTTASNESASSFMGLNPPMHAPAFLTTSDQNYLSGEGCFDLPPPAVFRRICTVYFNLVHPNLPIIDEAAFWSIWKGDNFDLSQFSFLVAQTMVFAAASFVDQEVLSSIGFSSKREARITYYKRAKLLFDFQIEPDPIATSQGCLLLSYYAPNHNRARVNSYWVQQAHRFAKIAGADRFRHQEDSVARKVMKRLWWCILFRDRVISLALRRPLQVELDPELYDESHILNLQDFQNELGQSPTHDEETQKRLVEIISATCRLTQCISPALDMMFRSDHIEDRINAAIRSLPIAVDNIRRSLDSLRRWHDHTSQMFPYPISLDDAHETVCVFANMLFFYHDSAVFALHSFRILLDESSPSGPRSKTRAMEEAREAIVEAMEDTTKRTQELIQARLISWLPISASALLSLPLILQAINVTAARGSSMERVEMRKMEVYTKTLKSMQVKFDGADFFSDVLTSIVAYAEDDSRIVATMNSWKHDRNQSGNSGGNGHKSGIGPGAQQQLPLRHQDSSSSVGNATSGTSTPRSSIKLGWENLMQKRPRLFLRLLLYFDMALCTGASPKETDFPPFLRKDVLA